MYIPSNFFIFVDIIVIFIYVVFILSALKNGMLLQIVSLAYSFFSILIAWFISPILATNFPIIKFSIESEEKLYGPLVNSIAYCLIIFIILKILYLFIAPLLKSISKIPIIGFINKIGGVILGLINGTLIVLLISMILETPIVQNGNQIKQQTLLKYTQELSDEAFLLTIKNINFEVLVDKIDDFDVSKARESLTNWMKEKGIIHENISRN